MKTHTLPGGIRSEADAHAGSTALGHDAGYTLIRSGAAFGGWSGHKVAIVEPTTSELVKGLMEREVARFVTPKSLVPRDELILVA